jgi:hypothetical protein
MPDYDPVTGLNAEVVTCDEDVYFIQALLNSVVVRGPQGRLHLLLTEDVGK